MQSTLNPRLLENKSLAPGDIVFSQQAFLSYSRSGIIGISLETVSVLTL